MLYLVGLGLGDKRDITLKGLEVVRKCSRVYLENYTAILSGTTAEELSAFYGVDVILADRTLIESGSDDLLEAARSEEVCVLVIGDPLCATTHTDLVLRAKEKGVGVARVVHNASIMNAVAVCGLQLYSFGLTVSVPFWTQRWKPESFYDKIKRNKDNGMHTLCLLDIRVKEISEENLIKGLEIYEPPRFMKVSECITQLLAIEEKRREGVVSRSLKAVGLARVGHESQRVVYATLEQLSRIDFGPPLHSLVIAGETHDMELEVLNALYSVESLALGKEVAAIGSMKHTTVLSDSSVTHTSVTASIAPAIVEESKSEDAAVDTTESGVKLNILEQTFRDGVKAGIRLAIKSVLSECTSAICDLESEMTQESAVEKMLAGIVKDSMDS